jgi:ribA/ribD-fused uncharacterized protein
MITFFKEYLIKENESDDVRELPKKDPNFFLSNYYITKFNSAYQDNVFEWNNAEQYYQANKFPINSNDFDKICLKSFPRGAYEMGNNLVGIKENWEEIKEEVMYEALILKFKQNKIIEDKLIATGDEELVYNCSEDFYWGIGDGTGKNRLGALLMQLRKELVEEPGKIEDLHSFLIGEKD